MATMQERQQVRRNRLEAMRHPTRAAALLILYERTASPKEIALEIGESTSNVSYHVRRLLRLGCIELVGTEPRRGAVEHFYRATEQHLIETDEWEELAADEKLRAVLEFAQPHVDEIVRSIRARMLGTDERFHLSRTRFTVDEEGHREIMEIYERAREEALEAEARAGGRLAKSGEAGHLVAGLLGCFEVPST